MGPKERKDEDQDTDVSDDGDISSPPTSVEEYDERVEDGISGVMDQDDEEI